MQPPKPQPRAQRDQPAAQQPSATWSQPAQDQPQGSAPPSQESASPRPADVTTPGAQPVPEPISPLPQRDVDPRRPSFVSFALPVSTTETLPGREIDTVVGVVVGIATRPRDMAHNPEMGYVNTAARQDAIGAMVQQAQEAGAHAVIGVRFDGGKISETVTELTAYGTAVTLRD